jgi:hypothetical protein
MEKLKLLVRKQFLSLKVKWLFAPMLISVGLSAQNKPSITGNIIDSESNNPVPFATVKLIEESGTSKKLIAGTMSNVDGTFIITPVVTGSYKLQVSSIGYKLAKMDIEVNGTKTNEAGTIVLQDSTMMLAEAIVTADRVKAKSESDKTIFYMNTKTLKASGNAPDILRHIPGIQVDLKQNISLEGKQNILLLVNGIERNKSYISQLNPSNVDRIEVFSTPPPKYNGDVSGVINIMLKEEKDTGFSGHAFSEIPTSKSVVYSFPSLGLNYSLNKVNFYTSYNGEVNYEDIDEITHREIKKTASSLNIFSTEHVRQKNHAHKFHYGIDYQPTPDDVFSLHGSFNTYSYEQDGNVESRTTGAENQIWHTLKEETDRNRIFYNSLYYKHQFEKAGQDISLDISNALIRTNNTVQYLHDSENNTTDYINQMTPKQTSSGIKADFNSPITEKFKLSTGLKTTIKNMHDETSSGFGYNEQLYAIYGAINYKVADFEINTGLRAENARTEIIGKKQHSNLYFLPYAAFNLNFSTQQKLQLSYRRSVNRPSVYALNPYSYSNSPYAIQKGNPKLKPEFKNSFYLEHSIRFGGNFVSSRLFSETTTSAMNNLTTLNDNNKFVTQSNNLGTIQNYGIQLSGSATFGILSLNSSVRLYHHSTRGNSLAQKYGIANRKDIVFESDFSSVLSFKHDFSFSVLFQYATPKNNIQDKTFSDALYFISLDKTFNKRLKVGIVSALPFVENFVYQGTEIQSHNFSSHYTGNLQLPTIPLMFRVSYQFSSGKKVDKTARRLEEFDKRPKPGL